jgi:HK97 family phage major capsid protein
MKRRDFLKLSPDQRREYFAREIVGKKLTRSFTVISRDAINEGERTVEIAFSSDEPYERWFYTEILSHDAKAIMLKRLNNGGALLKDHDTRQQIGVVVPGSAKTDGHVARCTVKFSQRQLAQDEFQDVLDGIRSKISVGYEIHKFEYDEKSETLTATLWEPLENSTVAIPADDSVGVGRSLTEDRGPATDGLPPSVTGQTESDPSQKNQTHPAQTPPVDSRTGAQRGRTQTRKTMALRRQKKSTAPAENELTCVDGDEDCGNERCDVHYEAAEERTADEAPETREARRIVDFARVFGEEQLALDMVAEGKNLADVRAAIQVKRKAKTAATTPAAEDPTVSANRNGGGNVIEFPVGRRLKHFSNDEAGRKAAYRSGMFLRAALFGSKQARAWCKENGIALVNTRTHSESDNESGGFLVPEEFENVMIDLREEFGFFRRLANVVPMATETKSRPRRTGGLTAYPIGARGSSRSITESTKNWDRVSLEAKKWGVLTKYEVELAEDAVISLADDIAGEIAYAFAVAEDQAGFNGDGSSTYHGITGILSKLKGLHGTIAYIAGLQVGTGNAYSELTTADFIGVLAKLPQYAAMRQPYWVCSRAFWANVMIRLTLAAGGVTAAEIEGARRPTFLGYPVEISQAMPTTEANSQVACLFGVFSLGVMLGDRRGVTIRQTDSNDTDFEEDLMSIKGTERFDINVHDVGNASSSAGARVPGPIVGLITAAA